MSSGQSSSCFRFLGAIVADAATQLPSRNLFPAVGGYDLEPIQSVDALRATDSRTGQMHEGPAINVHDLNGWTDPPEMPLRQEINAVSDLQPERVRTVVRPPQYGAPVAHRSGNDIGVAGNRPDTGTISEPRIEILPEKSGVAAAEREATKTEAAIAETVEPTEVVAASNQPIHRMQRETVVGARPAMRISEEIGAGTPRPGRRETRTDTIVSPEQSGDRLSATAAAIRPEVAQPAGSPISSTVQTVEHRHDRHVSTSEATVAIPAARSLPAPADAASNRKQRKADRAQNPRGVHIGKVDVTVIAAEPPKKQAEPRAIPSGVGTRVSSLHYLRRF